MSSFKDSDLRGGFRMTFCISIYAVFSLAYFSYWYAKNRQEGVFRLSVVLFLPVLGYLLFFLIWLKKRFIKGKNGTAYLLRDNQENTRVNESIKGFNEKRALNLVPMEEALLINDNTTKRRMLLDILKGDMSKYSFLLKMALNNEDTETSHYAAAGIVEVKRKLLQSVQECSQKYENKKDEATLISYAYALKTYLSCGLLDETNERKINETYQCVLKELLEFYTLEEHFFVDRINYEIEAGDLECAGVYCKRFMDAHRHMETPYLMYLKLFYQSRDRKSFNNILKALEDSTVSPPPNTWNIIKFWTEVHS